MIGTVDVKLQAHNPNFPLDPVFSFVNSPQNFRIRNVPKSIGNWNITNVYISITYPDNNIITNECLLIGGVWSVTTIGSPISGIVEKGFVVSANGKDEYDNVVSGYVLGVGDVIVKEFDGTIQPGVDGSRMTLLEEVPTQPNDGDVYKKNGVYCVWQNGQENLFSDVTKQYVDTQIQNVESDIRYELYDVPSTLQLKDRAVNYRGVAYSTNITFLLPAKITGKCRDFMLFISSSNVIPTILFSGATDFYVDGDTFPKPDSTGQWLYSFTEIIDNRFVVSLKKITRVTQ